jgi:ATP-dependent Lon protease
MLDMTYFYDEDDKKLFSPFLIERLSPIQLANVDLVEVIEARKEFTKDEWIDLLLRSSGMEPTNLENNVKRHLLERMVPLIENNYNLCEL